MPRKDPPPSPASRKIESSAVRERLIQAGLETFQALGYEASTVEHIRKHAAVSNGSFFHLFPTKQALAGAIFLEALRQYHGAMLSAVARKPAAAAGIRALIAAHLNWVVEHRESANFLFEQSRAEWLTAVRAEQQAANRTLLDGIEAWRGPAMGAGKLRRLAPEIFTAQLIGPAQIFCRAWLSGREATDPRTYEASLVDCALRALLTDS